MRTQAGEFNHRVTIEQITETRTGADVIKTWTTYVERWAKVTSSTGREVINAQQRWPEVDYAITVRGDSKTMLITPKMRVILTRRAMNKTLNILAVLDIDERGMEIKMMCTREGDRAD